MQEPKFSPWVLEKKGLASSSFGGLVMVLGANEKESYNPAIISSQTGCGRSTRPLLSFVENLAGEGLRNTGRHRPVSCHYSLST